MKFAVIGDFHIPDRADSIPEEFIAMLAKEKPLLILSQGDFTERDTMQMLEKIAKVIAVQGNCEGFTLPREQEVEIDGRKILLIHGSRVYPRGNAEQLKKIADEANADMLIYGHTHSFSFKKSGNRLLLNPGSATGAWSGGGVKEAPSFVIVNGRKAVHYFIKNGIHKEEFELSTTTD